MTRNKTGQKVAIPLKVTDRLCPCFCLFFRGPLFPPLFFWLFFWTFLCMWGLKTPKPFVENNTPSPTPKTSHTRPHPPALGFLLRPLARIKAGRYIYVYMIYDMCLLAFANNASAHVAQPTSH
jgi:hypothetical protein